MIRPFLVGAALALALVGCSTGEVTLGVQVTPQVGSAQAALENGPSTAPSPLSDLTVPDNLIPPTATVTRVRLLLNEVELQSGDSSGKCPNMGSESKVEKATVIELSTDNLASAARKDVSLGHFAAGTYTHGELEIKPLDADDDTSGPGVADFKADGASVIINGTYNGKDFEFRGHFKADQTSKGPIEVGANAASALTMVVDASSWFKAADGTPLDPTDASLHNQIAQGICTSLDLEAKDEPQHMDAMGGHEHHGHGGHGDHAPKARCVENAPTP